MTYNTIIFDVDGTLCDPGKSMIEAANACKVDSIGVVWGYGSIEELQTEGTTHIVEDIDQLRRLLIID